MNVIVVVPLKKIYEKKAMSVTIETINGSFTLKARHIDFISIVKPGVLTVKTENGQEDVMGVDTGIMVKKKNRVTISVRNAVQGTAIGNIEKHIEEHYSSLDDKQRALNTGIVGLERDLAKSIYDLKNTG